MRGPRAFQQAPCLGDDADRRSPAADFGMIIVRALRNVGRIRCDEGVSMSACGALASQLHANPIERANCGWLLCDLAPAATLFSYWGLPLEGGSYRRVGICPPLLSLC